MARIRWDALAFAAIALLASAIVASSPFEFLHGLSLDALTALRWRAFGANHEPATSPTVVIAFDEDSYRQAPFRGTPTVAWTREIGRVITAVVDGGASVVGFDIVFPASIEESEIPFGDETLGSHNRGFDRDFLRALAAAARAGKLVLAEVQRGVDTILPAPGQRVAVGQQRNIRGINVYTDSDDVVRRVPLTLMTDDKAAPGMALELASRALGAAPEINADNRVSLGGYRIPVGAPNAMTLNFDGGSDDIPTYSLADLRACLESGNTEFFRRNFQGKVVLFGSTLDFQDRKMTSKRFATAPSERKTERCAAPATKIESIARGSTDGVYIQATAINNLLRREAVWELPPLQAWLVVAAGSALAAVSASTLTAPAAALSLLAVSAAWTMAATAAFTKALALPLFEPIVAGCITLVAATGFRLFVVDKNWRFLRRAFALYLAPSVIERMVASGKPPALGGETREITVFFSDLVGFSTLSEAIEVTELVAIMNRYFSAMTDAIEEHGGFVDKYIGDAIVAVFGAPIAGTNHAEEAVRAALACHEALKKLNNAAAASDGAVLAHRVGLNSGPALVGNIGSRRRFNYTVMGNAVNSRFAARARQ